MNTAFSAASKRCSITSSIDSAPGLKAQMEMEMLAFMVILTVATSFVVEQLFMD